MVDNLEFIYSNGTVSINIVEDDYCSIEFFPNDQSTESFESAEYNNVFRIESLLDFDMTGYEWNIPNDFNYNEFKELKESVLLFLNNYLEKTRPCNLK